VCVPQTVRIIFGGHFEFRNHYYDDVGELLSKTTSDVTSRTRHINADDCVLQKYTYYHNDLTAI